jgi:peptidoglycan/LPS O-acetylase OafA/YrhL
MDETLIQWRTHFRADSLAAGVLLAVLAVRLPAAFDRLREHRRALTAVLIGGIAFLATVGKDGVVGSTIGYTVAYLTAAALLLLMYKATWVPRAIWISGPMAALGRYSYGIYIWHIAAAQGLLGWLPGVAYESWTPLEQALKYGSAIAFGVVATILVEKPVLRLRDAMFPANEKARDDDPVPSGWGAEVSRPDYWQHVPVVRHNYALVLR